MKDHYKIISRATELSLTTLLLTGPKLEQEEFRSRAIAELRELDHRCSDFSYAILRGQSADPRGSLIGKYLENAGKPLERLRLAPRLPMLG